MLYIYICFTYREVATDPDSASTNSLNSMPHKQSLCTQSLAVSNVCVWLCVCICFVRCCWWQIDNCTDLAYYNYYLLTLFANHYTHIG